MKRKKISLAAALLVNSFPPFPGYFPGRNKTVKASISRAVAAVSAAAMLVGVAACGSTAGQILSGTANLQSTPSGALFCQLQTAAGPTIVNLVDDTAPAVPIGGEVLVMATNALAGDLQSDCSNAAKNVGASTGIPVSPPASTQGVGTVAVAPVTS